MALEDIFLIGTVAAEMPASFEMEALKAQAVCARTYAVRKMTENRSYPLGADLSDDITTCQAFVDVKTTKTRSGKEIPYC
jgi:stage II sporulation protein D